MEQTSKAVSVEIVDHVAVIRLDDGKANALGHDAIDGLNAALDRAADGANSVVLVGREAHFCAGFDLNVMGGGDPAAARDLLGAGARLCHKLWTHPQPVTVAATGHALALGAILLMACDMRYGADGPYKIGTNEIAIGMPLPRFAVALAKERLSKRHLQVAGQHARVYTPAEAVDVGYLDAVVPAAEIEDAAVLYAREMAESLHLEPFARTRRYVRGPSAVALLDGLELDLADFSVGP